MTTLAPSHYLARKLADLMCRGAAFSSDGNMWVTLCLQPVNPGMTGSNLTEPTWPGYVRLPLGPNDWTAFDDGTVKTKITLLFAYNGVQTTFRLTSLALTDAPTGGNLLYFHNFPEPIEIPYSVPPSIPSGRLALRFASPVS
ncbi:hypothetical protein IHN63_00240 [Deinococcus sp. 6YEL10]|uniref:phage tail fiber protein n=1 Tax=Deinococcus sp. 6YEL10 TaxID=2745870 RepID=UPI001E34DE70|nr:hypothetical protein [Deinococcus sp. 6YEL10]MCD0159727.1 hypothetical protein [Deinococcus sp. 6YEL10]